MNNNKGISGVGETKDNGIENTERNLRDVAVQSDEPSVIIDSSLELAAKETESKKEIAKVDPKHEKKITRGFRNKIAAVLAAGILAVTSTGTKQENNYEGESSTSKSDRSKISKTKEVVKNNQNKENLVPKDVSLKDLLRPVNVEKYGYGDVIYKDSGIYVKLKKGYYIDKDKDTIVKK